MSFVRRLLPVWVTTVIFDGLCASLLGIIGYESTFARVWQGVASTVIGPERAIDRGVGPVLIGLMLHAGVALLWSAVFVAVATSWSGLRARLASPTGALLVAVAYGPLVWLAMSWVIIPIVAGRLPTITVRWWVQVFAHIPFVAWPIVGMTRRAFRSEPAG